MYKLFNKQLFIKFAKFPINSILSFLIRFLSILIFVDLLNLDFNLIYSISYIYVIIQSYFIQKKFIFKSGSSKFFKFLTFNLFIAICEYAIIIFLRQYYQIYFSLLIISLSVFTYLTRFCVYEFIIFKNKSA